MGELENEGTVKIAKAHERSYLFNRSRGQPVCYSLNFDGVHACYPVTIRTYTLDFIYFGVLILES